MKTESINFRTTPELKKWVKKMSKKEKSVGYFMNKLLEEKIKENDISGKVL